MSETLITPWTGCKVHWLPVNEAKHTEVLGYRVSTAQGKKFWDALNWDEWWLDYTAEGHMFSHPGCIYFHVKCKEGDGDGCVYRVRCWYAGGTYRGRPVVEIDIGMKAGRLHWIVRTEVELEKDLPTLQDMRGMLKSDKESVAAVRELRAKSMSTE